MKLLLLIAAFLAFASCGSQNMAGYPKMDSALQKRINELSESNSDTKIQVLAKLSEAPATELKEAMQRMGVTVETMAGSIMTASGSANAISELASMEIVETLQLSQERNMLNR
ncbi:MAG: hypothetical protein ACRBF0_04325 [Calditrichia bacterium]